MAGTDLSVLNESFDFDDIQQAVKEVKYEGKVYTLREPMSDAVTKWKNAQMEGMVFENGKPKGARGLASIEPLLISMCLFDDKDKPVSLTALSTWSTKVTRKLYAWLLEVGELKDTTTPDEAKNA